MLPCGFAGPDRGLLALPLTDRHGAALERQQREGPGAVPPSSGRGSRSFSVAGLAIEQHPVAQAPPHFERFLPSRHAVNLTALAAVTAARALMVGKRAGYLAELAFLVGVTDLRRPVSSYAEIGRASC